MKIVRSDCIPQVVSSWPEKLAELTRVAWTGPDGKCHFPYKPLITPEFWEREIGRGWADGSIVSWVLLDGDRIASHVALLSKGTHWELGRLMSHRAGPDGTAALCRERIAFTRARGIQARMECTQAHTSAQWHADNVGMRFAGIGFLDKIEEVSWDIIFFDTLDMPEFAPQRGILGDPLGTAIECTPTDRQRLIEISQTMTTDRWEPLPPRQFHVLPRLLGPVQRIIEINTSLQCSATKTA
jgi:hypothetical protein